MDNKYLEKFSDTLCELTYWNRETKEEITLMGKILKIENEFISFMMYVNAPEGVGILDIDSDGQMEENNSISWYKKFIVKGLKKIFKNDIREIDLYIFPSETKNNGDANENK